MELLKDYDFEIHYHPRKYNRVVDALSQKTRVLAYFMIREWKAMEYFSQFYIICHAQVLL